MVATRSLPLFLGARSISILGDRIAELVLPLLVLQRTGSALDAGIIGAVYRLPVALFALWAGSVVDRRSSRSVMVAADLGSGALFGILAVSLFWGKTPLWLLAAVVFLAGLTQVWFTVAAGTYLPRLVASERLAAANGYLEAADSAATLGGPILGGVVFQVIGTAVAIATDAVSFMISAVLIFFTTPRPSRQDAGGPESRAGVLAGFRALRTNPAQTLVQVGYGALNVYAGAIVLLIVVLGRDTLHLSAASIGLVLAGSGAGGLLSSAILAPRLNPARWGPTLGAALLVMALSAIALSISQGVASALVANAVLDGAACLGFVVTATVRHTITPTMLLGRITAASYLSNTAIRVAAMLLAGWVVTGVGQRQSFQLLAAVLALIGMVLIMASPGRRLVPASGELIVNRAP